ncbi:hypothetical protein HYPBUDRAFT_152993 [Hyphopichia burtonii NRRL Y-1933]|uniref:Uncharacterized protein n=1 Tax=Hyphopichia burtonii NRRL Y-1933 TaxID=984485 RepID=A0A1E4RIF2_9ASCO|nr:hypothetical protein HYPBUDRAFT_152993 [Hyphopichia burtonii NRRL Y-1933]ODV67047.1 hypothetical protein HYPBUDRAFT_152993 [Hyphopichia burtonii NRRL Y-1933]
MAFGTRTGTGIATAFGTGTGTNFCPTTTAKISICNHRHILRISFWAFQDLKLA